jgi:multiple sugar transport system permease protein
MSRLESHSPAAVRGMSDLAIRNLFIIPTIIFLIVFNIFPLLYSLGYSFTDYAASRSGPVNFVGLQTTASCSTTRSSGTTSSSPRNT